MEGYERLKSVGGGGRYDALATDGRSTYPGVGISFGVSRTLLPLLAEGVLAGSRAVPSAVLVALADEESRPVSERIATDLRRRGVACEVAVSPQKYGKQIRYAERRGIPFVWFPASEPGASDEVKDIRSGDQVEAVVDRVEPTRRRPPRHHHDDPRPPPSRRRTRDPHPRRRHPHRGGRRTEVVLAGWVARRRDHGGVAFLDLREASGVAQVVVRDEAVAHSLRNEYCLKVTGTVQRRPEGNANPHLASGEIEVIASDVEVLNPSAVLPFPIDDAGSKGEATSARRPACAIATSTCAAAVPRPRSGCAAR